MQVNLEYGKYGLSAEIPDANLIGVLNLKTSPPLLNPDVAIKSALSNPIGTASLSELARNARCACVVICDITRPVPNQVLLPIVLSQIEEAGIVRDQITILIATGTHRPNIGAELEAIVGPEIAREYRCINHVCTDANTMVDLGFSPKGVHVKLNRYYVDAQLRVTVGLIEPHFMAGFSGGRKLIMPGIAALETVQAWHSPQFLEHPLATNGVVQGNPVHEESLAIAKLARPSLTIDVTLDQKNCITGVFAGDLEEAWMTGVQFARTQVGVNIPELADIVVTTCAGYPLDATFYQAVKGMVGALPIVKEGGEIIIASECSEGIGSDHFRNLLLEANCLAEFVSDIQSDSWTYVPDQWEVEELARARKHCEVTCVCRGIPDDLLSQCFVKPASSVEDAISSALTRLGENARIAVIPKGPYVIPAVVAA